MLCRMDSLLLIGNASPTLRLCWNLKSSHHCAVEPPFFLLWAGHTLTHITTGTDMGTHGSTHKQGRTLPHTHTFCPHTFPPGPINGSIPHVNSSGCDRSSKPQVHTQELWTGNKVVTLLHLFFFVFSPVWVVSLSRELHQYFIFLFLGLCDLALLCWLSVFTQLSLCLTSSHLTLYLCFSLSNISSWSSKFLFKSINRVNKLMNGIDKRLSEYLVKTFRRQTNCHIWSFLIYFVSSLLTCQALLFFLFLFAFQPFFEYDFHLFLSWFSRGELIYCLTPLRQVAICSV